MRYTHTSEVVTPLGLMLNPWAKAFRHQCHGCSYRRMEFSRNWTSRPQGHLFECCINVIMQLCALCKVHGDWILTGGHVDHGRGHGEQALVACEVLHTQRGAHDYELQGGAAA